MLCTKTRLQAALRTRIAAGPYYEVVYDDRGQPLDVDTDKAERIVPAAVVANEVSSSFAVDPRHGRGRIAQREAWTWAARVGFNEEVTSFHAERCWLLAPLILSKTADYADQVTVDLVAVNYGHPTTQEPQGSLLDFVFEARLSRR